MMVNELIDENLIEVSNLLYEIKGLDEMISLHRDGGNEFSAIQYSQRREKALSKLSALLKNEFNIDIVNEKIS